MTMPPTYLFDELGTQAKRMSRDCKHERTAMILEYVALGSMILMAGFTANQLLREAFGPTEHDRGRSR